MDWIWISSNIFCIDMVGYGLTPFFVDGYGWIWILQISSMSISTREHNIDMLDISWRTFGSNVVIRKLIKMTISVNTLISKAKKVVQSF